MSTPWFNMEKHCIVVEFIIVLVVVCVAHETRADGQLPAELANHVEYVCKEEHWKEMKFTAVRCEFGWVNKDHFTGTGSTFDPIDRLKIVPYMMGCGYGQILFHSLWLAIQTGDVCNSITRTLEADDCWTKLNGSLENCAFTILKLLRTLELIHSSDDSVIPSPYYGILSSTRRFLETNDPRENYKEEPINGTRQTIILAHSLANILADNCEPKIRLSTVDQITNEFTKQNTVKSLYVFYLNRLNLYITYMDDHLVRLGFHYDTRADKMGFITPYFLRD